MRLMCGCFQILRWSRLPARWALTPLVLGAFGSLAHAASAAEPKEKSEVQAQQQSRPPETFVDPANQTKKLYIGLGVYTEALSKYAATADGNPAFFSVLDFPLAVGVSIPIAGAWRLVPMLLWNPLLPRAMPDGHGSVETLLARAPFALSILGGAVETTFGFNFQLQRTYGDGGAVTLNDGTSTADFSAPGSSRLTALFQLELGLQKEWRGALFNFATVVTAPLNEKRRTFGLLATATFRVWEFN